VDKFSLVPYTRGRVIEVGTSKPFPHFIGVGPDDVALFADQTMDAVYSGVLDKLDKSVLKEWIRVLKNGGHLCVEGDVTEVMRSVGCTWDLLVNKDGLQVYKKGGPGFRESWKKPISDKRALVIRYGGFGDMLQAASIFPALKKQGYHITVNTYERGKDLLKADPYVDDFLIQDQDQVPGDQLGEYIEYLQTQYHKVVNLCESVEGSLVALPGRTPRYWPKRARLFLMNKNYVEMTHAIAETDGPFDMKFYSTQEEREWAAKERISMGNGPIILWSLSGSSVNKTWPYVDQIIARLLTTFPECRMIFAGGETEKMLEGPWEKEPRVLKRCGVWSIRETIAFAKHQCEVVIGPDTGVMQAVGHEPVGKVLLLGHSTKEQVSKYWINTVSIEPPASVPCSPCLLLHYSFKDCHRGPQTGVSLCQEMIPAEVVWVSTLGLLKKANVLERIA
jgi:ADP-heptose:LPS heptosyltransferase